MANFGKKTEYFFNEAKEVGNRNDSKYDFDNNFDPGGTIEDIVGKYGSAILYQNTIPTVTPDVRTKENLYIHYRNEFINPLLDIDGMREKDLEMLDESLTIFTWVNENDEERVLFAPLTFYSINRLKIYNSTTLPGYKSSLKEYYATEDININGQLLFYDHDFDTKPQGFLEAFMEMVDFDGIVEVSNPFLNLNGINYMFITEYSIEQSQIMNNQTVTFNALSEKYKEI